jgi:hypothetical protein
MSDALRQAAEQALDALNTCDPFRCLEAIDALRAALADRERRDKDDRAIRRLLGRATCGWSLYTDDGECSDASQQPSIDFLRDSPLEIDAALRARRGEATERENELIGLLADAKKERDALRGLLREARAGLDEHWWTYPEGADVVARIDAALAGEKA